MSILAVSVTQGQPVAHTAAHATGNVKLPDTWYATMVDPATAWRWFRDEQARADRPTPGIRLAAGTVSAAPTADSNSGLAAEDDYPIGHWGFWPTDDLRPGRVIIVPSRYEAFTHATGYFGGSLNDLPGRFGDWDREDDEELDRLRRERLNRDNYASAWIDDDIDISIGEAGEFGWSLGLDKVHCPERIDGYGDDQMREFRRRYELGYRAAEEEEIEAYGEMVQADRDEIEMAKVRAEADFASCEVRGAWGGLNEFEAW